MRNILLPVAAGALLLAAAPVKLAPADDRPDQPVGIAARHKNGPDPTVKPPVDVGAAEDPVTVPATPSAPPAKPNATPKG